MNEISDYSLLEFLLNQLTLTSKTTTSTKLKTSLKRKMAELGMESSNESDILKFIFEGSDFGLDVFPTLEDFKEDLRVKMLMIVPEITRTKGNVIVQEIEIGDIHFEFEYGVGLKVKVKTLPVWDGTGFGWVSEQVSNGKEINYYVSHNHSHYGPNIYDHEAYQGCTIL